MRVADNKLKTLINFFYSELEGLYEGSEIEAMLHLAVEHYLNFSQADIVKRVEENLNQSDLLNLYDCAKALKKNIPLQYILKEAWFYNNKFTVSSDVLIPRPETEELVDLVIKANKTSTSILDIGTGSGCIAVSLAKNLKVASLYGCDISDAALQIAKKNSERYASDICFFKADALDTHSIYNQTGRSFDVILSNPPYILESEKDQMSLNVIEHEPHLALFAKGNDPIIFYKRIIDACKLILNPKGYLYFELNPLTSKDVLYYAEHSGLFTNCQLLKDMSGKVRFLKAVRL
jgi:release factor glutamine methyltransferase